MTIRRNAKPGETVRYIGANIGYMPGVPMKDMDAAEWNALDGDLRENAIRAGLYALGDPAAAENEPEREPEREPAKRGKGSKGAQGVLPASAETPEPEG